MTPPVANLTQNIVFQAAGPTQRPHFRDRRPSGGVLYRAPEDRGSAGRRGFVQATFDLRTWPFRRGYFYAKAYGANGRVNFSRVFMVEQ